MNNHRYILTALESVMEMPLAELMADMLASQVSERNPYGIDDLIKSAVECYEEFGGYCLDVLKMSLTDLD
jgi:hypothetical protein